MTTDILQNAGEQAGLRPQPDASTAAQPLAERRRRIAIIASGAIVIAAAFFIWRVFFAASGVPDSIVVVSGRIEGDDSAVAPKTTRRILEVRVREGETVNAGDTLAILY